MRRLDHPIPKAGGRSPPRHPRRRSAAKGALAAMMLVLIAGSCGWAWRTGSLEILATDVRAAAVAASARVGFRLREVLLAGRRSIPRDTVLAASALQLGSPMVELDPEQVRTRLENNEWIKHARVTTRLPDALFIEIEERRPFALWQRGGVLRLIDGDGAVITDRGLHRYDHLPLIVAPSEPARARPVVELLAREPDFHRRVHALIRVGARRWDIRFDNGIDVRLPEADAAAAWAELAHLDRRHALLARHITAIDLRIPGRVVVTRADDPDAGAKGGKR